jgi:hypothetical protein
LLHLYTVNCNVAKIMSSKIVTLAIAVLSLAVVATTANLSTMVYAEKPADAGKPTDPDCFGDSASDLAQDEPGMGEHSKEGSVSGSHPFDSDGPEGDEDKPGRQGIGNVGGGEPPDQVHPSDVAGALGGDCDEEED